MKEYTTLCIDMSMGRGWGATITARPFGWLRQPSGSPNARISRIRMRGCTRLPSRCGS